MNVPIWSRKSEGKEGGHVEEILQVDSADDPLGLRWCIRALTVLPHALDLYPLRCRNLRFHTFKTNYWSFLFEYAMEICTILEKSLNHNTYYCQLCVKLLNTQPYSHKN